MERYRKILAAVDGSDASKNAFRRTCRMAREGDSMMTALMSVPIYQDQFDVFTTKEKVSDTLRAEGDKILSDIRKIAEEEHVPVRVLLDEGSPSKTIPAVADEGGYDLIVMGRRGMTHVERALMGSVTARVIGYTQKDVLVVPDNASLGWKNILLATDGSKHGSAAVDGAINYARSYKGKLNIIQVVEVTEEFQACAPDAVDNMIFQARKNVDDIKVRAGESGVEAEVFVREGRPYEVITDLAAQLNAGTIVMGSHGRTGLMRLFMGSVTARVIGHAPCPVLVIKSTVSHDT
jgi:nucleotide-binding universal stress UspA family protein